MTESITDFIKRLLDKLPYEKHSVRCQLRIDNKTWDHWYCGCDCHE